MNAQVKTTRKVTVTPADPKYADKGITGTSAKKRPEFLKMIRDAEKSKIDLVITKSVSRFTRNTLDGLEYVRRLKRCGVGCISRRRIPTPST